MQNHCTHLTRSPQKNLNDVTSDDPVATEASFSQCECSKYRSRRRSHPKIPSNAIQLSDMIPTTAFRKFHKTKVSLNDQTALLFFSHTIFDLIPQMNIQFDGTLLCSEAILPTMDNFVTVERHSLSAIH